MGEVVGAADGDVGRVVGARLGAVVGTLVGITVGDLVSLVIKQPVGNAFGANQLTLEGTVTDVMEVPPNAWVPMDCNPLGNVIDVSAVLQNE